MSKRHVSMSDINPKYHAVVERLLTVMAREPKVQTEAAPDERRIRQSRVTLNKLEADYLDELNLRHGKDQVLSQAVRLRLGNGSWYKPDFFIPSLTLFVETKGPHSFRGGFEALKMAASAHPWAKFRLVWRISGEWKFQEVLP